MLFRSTGPDRSGRSTGTGGLPGWRFPWRAGRLSSGPGLRCRKFISMNDCAFKMKPAAPLQGMGLLSLAAAAKCACRHAGLGFRRFRHTAQQKPNVHANMLAWLAARGNKTGIQDNEIKQRNQTGIWKQAVQLWRHAGWPYPHMEGTFARCVLRPRISIPCQNRARGSTGRRPRTFSGQALETLCSAKMAEPAFFCAGCCKELFRWFERLPHM